MRLPVGVVCLDGSGEVVKGRGLFTRFALFFFGLELQSPRRLLLYRVHISIRSKYPQFCV
jgi:hypothetical protein